MRRATLEDLPLLVGHRRGMWEEVDPDLTKKQHAESDRVYRRWVRPRLASGKLLAWIVEERGEPVASGALWIMRIHPRPRAPDGLTPYLLSMFTEPAHRGKGHAARIVRAAMALAKKEGYPRMTLHASEMGRSVYEKLGWERTWEMTYKFPTRAKRAPRRAPRGGSRPSPGRSRSA